MQTSLEFFAQNSSHKHPHNSWWDDLLHILLWNQQQKIKSFMFCSKFLYKNKHQTHIHVNGKKKNDENFLTIYKILKIKQKPN